MVRKLTVTLLSTLFILVPSMAFAVDMEFYTYGGFDAVVNAFVQLVMIFGDSSYQTLYYTAVVCGIAGGATVAVVKLIAGVQSNILGWAPVAALGIAIYVGLFVPKGNLTIYDPVFNKFQTVANVPNGVVIIAGTMNAIERGLVDIVSNAADPDAFQTQAGGKGFLGLFNLVTTPITAVDTNLDSSITRYIDDCVGFALNNPASGLTVNELRKNTVSFSTSLAKAANPANFTVFYNAANPNGQTMTCRDAWTAITTAMTPAALQANTNAQCSTLGFDVSNAAERIQCQTILYNSQNVSALGAASLDAFVQQSYIAQKLDYVFRSGDGTAATNYQFMMNASGSMKAANDWLPILRAVLTAIAVALIPFLCIFLPTPICGRVLGMMFGLFVWLTTWGVTDAIMHQFAMNHAYKLMEQVRQCQLGMDAFLFFPAQAAKTLSMFGTMRLGGLLLATALTGMLVKFGGHAMAMLAGNITGQIQGAGVKGESQTADPSARAQSITSNTAAMPTQAWANGHAWNARTGEAWAKMDSGTTSFENMSAELGGAGGVSEMQANQQIAMTVSRGATGAAMKEAGLPQSFGVSKFDSASNLNKLFGIQTAFGGNAGERGKSMAAAESAIATVAARAGMQPSELAQGLQEFTTGKGYTAWQSVQALSGSPDAIAAGGYVGTGDGFAASGNAERAAQIRAAANLAAPASWKRNAELWDSEKKELTPLGVGKFIAAMQGVGIAYGMQYGHSTMDLTEGGKMAQLTATGIVPGGDAAGMERHAKFLDRAGMKDEAAAVRAYATEGKSFAFTAASGSDGRVATYTGAHGGAVTDQDRSVVDKGRTENVGKRIHRGDETRIGNDTHIGNDTRRGNTADIGSKSRVGDVATIENYSGKIDDTSFTNATVEMRGNTFTATGNIAGEGWGTVSGTTGVDKSGQRYFQVEKSMNDGQRMTAPGASLDIVLRRGTVPVSSMANDQARYSYASAFVKEMQKLRTESYDGSNVSTVSASASGGLMVGGSGGKVASEIRHQDNTNEGINKQMKAVLKIMYAHPNTEAGRRTTADELKKYFDNNAHNSDTNGTEYFTNFHAEQPWTRKSPGGGRGW